MRVGVDSGGTFTDLVASDGSIVKVPSTPTDPGSAVRSALARCGSAELLAHGTTVATNALLERTLAPVALVTTSGFGDVIEIARQARPSLYDPSIVRPTALVPRELRFEVGGRLDGRGREIEPLRLDDLVPLSRLHSSVAVAVCLLHSDLDPTHERVVADHLRATGRAVTCSYEVAPEHREYERLVTTVIDAGLRSGCVPYLRSLSDLTPQVGVMTSGGGLVDVDAAAEHPVALLLSGPAGGLLGTAALARILRLEVAVAFDMGGTSTDVGLALDGVPEPAGTRFVGGFPVRTPSLAIHTIGAGGGSIASIDAGGALVVGPRSAGAIPGPAAYGRGGLLPTVTDADLMLDRIPRASDFCGLGPLDLDAASHALRRAGVDPEGVASVVDATMSRAVRVMTVERGIDPANASLVAFGGAGPLHACSVAEQVGMARVVIPPRAGVWSAVGLLCAPWAHEVVRSVQHGDVVATLDAAIAEASARGPAGGAIAARFDCRYEGQAHEITVDSPDDFATEHRRRNGFALDRPVETVAVRVRMELPSRVELTSIPTVARTSVRGPATVNEVDCTTYIPAGWRARVGPLGSWIVERS
jgi:N-methylhydantoinase A/oxoprolinase/acetone carboxylase beta subunit